jgi:hypothetical protein
MRAGRAKRGIITIAVVLSAAVASAQQAGGIRGMVYDKDFNAPLAEVRVQILETGQSVTTSDEGNYVFGQVKPGKYTLIFSKDGYTQQIKREFVVSAGVMAEQDAWLAGNFTEMDEFVVQDLQIESGTEAKLLVLRKELPAMIDSISADLMSQANLSDAAAALNLVAGATVQDGKYAVIRGLPDRYVNSQINAIRLPTADPDKRAVQLDQFPAAAIESVQVSKTFTPDQQGDASGGAVNIVLKGIPEETVLKLSTQMSYNSSVTGNDDFLTYNDADLDYWGNSNRDIPIDGMFEETVGVSYDDAPYDYKWSLTAGGKYELFKGLKVGGLASLFYERDSSFYDAGIDDKYWVEAPGEPMTPQYGQGTPTQGDFKTSLFDVTKGSEEVKWGSLGTIGLETENHSLALIYLYTRVAEHTATLAEDTRGKHYYFPDYNPGDPKDPGNQERDAAPYLRTETLEYTERITETVQLRGDHRLALPEFHIYNFLTLLSPELDWSIANSTSELIQPDKRQFGSTWWAASYNKGFPPYVPPSTSPAVHRPFKPAANFTLGNLQRIWKDIYEESDQYAVNLTFPFRQWTNDEGYVKLGVFDDKVTREYNQDSYSNFNDNKGRYEGPWEDLWSAAFPSEDHPLTAAEIDVDYYGEQHITAWYWMVDVPVTSFLNIIGGVRHEDTELSIINIPEEDVTWIPPDAPGSVKLNPGDADVFFMQEDVLPSIGFVFSPIEQMSFRGSYSETVARQTFKELTPIQQQEFLGGDVFIGNPFLQMSALKNYDLRLDYEPYEGGLISVSYFKKDITGPIEYVQRIADFVYTTPVNYPEGELSGYEFEVRQDMGRLWKRFAGLSVGGNATIIDSEVTLPEEEAAQFEEPNIDAPMPTRDMTNAPEHLYNVYFTYDLGEWNLYGLSGTQVSLFYTVRGDTLVAGAGQSKGKFVPNVYEKEFGTLNFSLIKKFGEHLSVKFAAKNLLDPDIQTVYRSKYIDDDVTKTSYQKGRDFSLSLSYAF